MRSGYFISSVQQDRIGGLDKSVVPTVISYIFETRTLVKRRSRVHVQLYILVVVLLNIKIK